MIQSQIFQIIKMIEINSISKKYGTKIVLRNISFQADRGECIVIVGKNGCGKTTLMQILAGVMKPDEGEIRYLGQEILHKSKGFHKYCGYVPQENPLMEELSVKDNLKLWGVTKSKQYEQILDSFQLREILRTKVEKLSGGMKRRVAIACALGEWPPILLLDEPTTALDIFYKESIEEWLREYNRMNGIVIMTTHDESEILKADRCLVMKEGELIELSKEDISMENIRKYIRGSV